MKMAREEKRRREGEKIRMGGRNEKMRVEGYSAKFCGTVFSFLNILLDPDFFVLLLANNN